MYSLILTTHIVAFFFNIALVIISDFKGLLWLLGKKQVLSKKWMTLFHRLIWIGLSISILTGVYLFWGMKDYLLTAPAFITKVGFVVALVINSFFIDAHLKIATTMPFASLEKKEKGKLLISGLISTISWIGVAVSAQLLFV